MLPRLMRVFIPKVEAFDREGNLGQQWLDGMKNDFYDDNLMEQVLSRMDKK